jgi:hypothetical protein
MAAVQVSGLADLRNDLKKLENAAAARQVKNALADAADYVAVRARGKVPSRSGRAAGSIKGGSTGASAYVKGGGGNVPYYGWLDFGSRTPKKGNPRSRGPWSGSGKGPIRGRFIYPAIDENQNKIVELVGNGLNQVIRDAGLG